MQANLSAVIVDYGAGTQISRTGDGVPEHHDAHLLGRDEHRRQRLPDAGSDVHHRGHRRRQRLLPRGLQAHRAGPNDRWRVTRGTLDSCNRSSFWYQDATAVIAGSKNTYNVALQPTEHIFEAGHRIGIVVVGNLYGAGRVGQHPVRARPGPADHDRHAPEQGVAADRRRHRGDGRRGRVHRPDGSGRRHRAGDAGADARHAGRRSARSCPASRGPTPRRRRPT